MFTFIKTHVKITSRKCSKIWWKLPLWLEESSQRVIVNRHWLWLGPVALRRASLMFHTDAFLKPGGSLHKKNGCWVFWCTYGCGTTSLSLAESCLQQHLGDRRQTTFSFWYFDSMCDFSLLLKTQNCQSKMKKESTVHDDDYLESLSKWWLLLVWKAERKKQRPSVEGTNI